MHFPRPSLLVLVAGIGWTAAGLASASLGACSGSSGNSTAGDTSGSSSTSGSTSSGAPTFTEVYTSILGPTCGDACHQPGAAGVEIGFLDMSSKSTAYQNLYNVAAMGTPDGCLGKGTRVVPGNVDESVLAEKIDPALFPSLNCGAIMPQGESNLPESQIEEVESWIAAGALNN